MAKRCASCTRKLRPGKRERNVCQDCQRKSRLAGIRLYHQKRKLQRSVQDAATYEVVK
jgi:hypothetical protein